MFAAIIFVSGGILASRLAASNPQHSGFVIGLFYGGVGLGIVLSALTVQAMLGGGGHGWQASWVGFGVISALCTALAWPVAAKMTTDHRSPSAATIEGFVPPMRRYAVLMAAYGLFGIGYIGYMTFVIAVVTAFFLVLGLATVVSSKLWAGILQHARSGGALAMFCRLLSVATVIPAVSNTPAPSTCWTDVATGRDQDVCCWLRRSGDAGDLGPNLEGLGLSGSILDGWNVVAAE